MMHQDARRHPRYPARMSMLLQHGAKKTRVETEDISRAGLCVRSPVPIDVYSVVYLTLPMPSQPPIQLTGMVVSDGGAPVSTERPVHIQLHFFANYPEDRWHWLVSTVEWRAALTDPLPATTLPGLPRPS